MNRSPRVDYDTIAPTYDTQPYRARPIDPAFLTFIEQRAASDAPTVLDIGCGTGNQLAANRAVAPHARMIGVDRSIGMLRRARAKVPSIAWVQSDAATLPFAARSIDFISCQYAFHHFQDKAAMLRETFRVLHPGGRLVLRNLCPQESPDWLYYEYFPQAEIVDLRDFWPPEAILAVMEGAGFQPVTAEYEHLRFEQDLAAWLTTVRRRDICSQLQTISDAAYKAGVRRLEQDLADPSASRLRADHLCLLTLRGAKPGAERGE